MAVLIGESLSKNPEGNSTEDDWLLHIVKKMLADTRDYGSFVSDNPQVKFVTFNFDTFIEDRLRRLIKASFPDEKSAGTLQPFPVLHIHGRVDPVPSHKSMKFDPHHGHDDNWVDWVNVAAENINLTSD